jgi:hypothetical protein
LHAAPRAVKQRVPTGGFELLHGTRDGRLRHAQHGGSLHCAAQGLDGAGSAQTFEIVQGSRHKNLKNTRHARVWQGLNSVQRNSMKINGNLKKLRKT